MAKKQNVVRGAANPFYDKKEGKKPVLLIILPILMVLVIAASLYLAYRENFPMEDGSASSATEVVSQA